MNDDCPAEEYSMRYPNNQSKRDTEYAEGIERYFEQSLGTNIDKLRHFTKFVPRQTLSMFIAKHELFKQVIGVHGHIIECGVFLGSGLMTWAKLSSIFEPVNHIRRIVGFDTFTGFPGINEKDRGEDVGSAVEGGFAAEACEDLKECIRLYDLNRPIGHIPRVELVVGDATNTIPEYIENNKHLVVAMLYLDFDLYEPTKTAIELFYPRMPKGAVIVFDELDEAPWPGETMAVLETLGINNLRIRRFPYASGLSYAVLE